jgi:hypothetical protein
MERFGKVLLAALPVLLFSSVASAIPLVVNCSTISGPTELNTNIVCPQFNLGGGAVLTSIDIAVSGGISGSITLTNNGGSSATVSGATSSQFNYGPLAGFGFANPIYIPGFSTGPQTVLAGQTQVFSGLTSGTLNGSLGSDTTIFAPYIGVGSFNIPVSTLTGLTILGGGGNIASASATSANGTAVVTYNYDFVTAAPEPATLSLLGLGLLGFGFMARKLKKQ